MNLSSQMDVFIAHLNSRYASKGVNAVARQQQLGHNSWYVFVTSDVGQETYVVGYEGGGMTFIREMSADEYNWRAQNAV